MTARFRCYLCPGRPHTEVRVPAGASDARREQIAMAALHAHTDQAHPWRAA